MVTYSKEELFGLETKLEVDPNQAKVICEKYIKDKDVRELPYGPEKWLRGVANKIALAEVLYLENISKNELFNGINHKIRKEDTGEEKPSLMYMLHGGLTNQEQRDTNYRKFVNKLREVAETNEDAKKVVSEYEEKFYDILSNWKFLPNSPTLMNAWKDYSGLGKHATENNNQYSACYVVPVPDSVEGWLDATKVAALIHKTGGGTGFSGARIRPKGDMVKTTHGIASGGLSIFNIVDAVTEEIKQGGCVALGTRISTKNGLIEIGNIVPLTTQPNSWIKHKNGMLTVMTDNGTKISDECYNNGKAEVITLTTEKGYSITATPEHRFRIIDKNGNYIWKYLNEIKKGDWICLQKDTFPEKSSYKFKEFNYKPHFNANPVILPTELSKEFGEFIGYFIGDGALSFNNRGTGRLILSFALDQKDLIAYMIKNMHLLFGLIPSIQKKENDNSINAFYNNTTFCTWLKHVGINKKSALTAYVPEIIFRGNKEFAEAFVRGLFSADGTISKDGVISMSSASEKLIGDLQILLLSLGIPTRKSICKTKNNSLGKIKNKQYRLNVITSEGNKIFVNKIRFLSQKKNLRLTLKPKKFEYNDIIPNQEETISHIYTYVGAGCARGKKSKGANRSLYRDIMHYISKATGKRFLTKLRLRMLAEKHAEIKNSELNWFLINEQFYDRVAKLEFGETWTVDLSVPENNTYIANGFVSHNTRRGANMGILPYHHPDIIDFINMKAILNNKNSKIYNKIKKVLEENYSINEKNPKDKQVLELITKTFLDEQLRNFNISVGLDQKFFKAVKEDGEYELINPHTKKVVGKKSAKEVFDLMVKHAWETGDPGYVMLDIINNSESNPTPKLGQIESTNPCGEKPLLPNEPCNLGSINVAKFVKYENKKPYIDYKDLEETTKLATILLDDVIDVNNFPTDEVEIMAKGNRRIGLGIMGWAEMLVLLGIPYDSEEALKLGGEVMGFIEEKATEQSIELAKRKGVFPFYKDSIFDKDGEYFKGDELKPRNCVRTTIAPTGTISNCAGLQGAGIEPFYSLAYDRLMAPGIDQVERGEKIDDKYIMHEFNPLLEKLLEENNYFGLDKKILWKKIEKNHGSIKDLNEIPENIQRLFRTAHDINYEWHIRHQAVFQKHTGDGVSKTINFPNSATIEDIRNAYLLAAELGLKGITVYRDGCKSIQTLISHAEKKENIENLLEKERPKVLGTTEKFVSPFGSGFLTYNIIGSDVNHPYEIFINIGKGGGDVQAIAEGCGRLISMLLKANIKPKEVIEQLRGIGGNTQIGFGEKKIRSLPDAIGVALGTAINTLEEIIISISGKGHQQETQEKPVVIEPYDLCPQCGGKVKFEGGCKKCTRCTWDGCG